MADGVYSRTAEARDDDVEGRLSDPVRKLSYVELEFSGEIWYWRGPSPFHFVTVPEEESAALEAASAMVSYGWGMIPVQARVGDTSWKTSLFPKDERYVVPLKDAIRTAEELELGEAITVRLNVDV